MKEFRESTGLTQKEFAEHFEIPLQTLRNWEQGRRNPPEYLPQLLKRVWKAENTCILDHGVGKTEIPDCLPYNKD